MRLLFYPKLAANGMRKNRRIYGPYLLTGILMTAMLYILAYLSAWPGLNDMKGGATLRIMLPLGFWVIAFFSLLLLFYSNSFLIRQRYREFGLYNILGMDKRNLCRVIFWETLFSALLTSLLGLIAGALFSKLAELLMLNMMYEQVSYDLSINWDSVRTTLTIFAAIYLLLFLSSVLKVSRTNPLALMRSSSYGEKPPKANWFLALLGAVILAAAYWIALHIRQPVKALFAFFIAVIMVILATYLLMVSGSVTLCRALQKNKSYYYRPRHFVFVSSMGYRMKRNGAGLASICILCTMVLVILCSTSSLYFGAEDAFLANYPNSFRICISIQDMQMLRSGAADDYHRAVSAETPGAENITEAVYFESNGLLQNDRFLFESDLLETASSLDLEENITLLYILSPEQYSKLTGEKTVLDSDECLLLCRKTSFASSTFHLSDLRTYRVTEASAIPDRFQPTNLRIFPELLLVPGDYDALAERLDGMTNSYGYSTATIFWYCSFDMDTDAQTQIEMQQTLQRTVETAASASQDGFTYRLDCREASRKDFFGTYNGLFLIGILLNIVFLFAAVLIIYYKQISEGYEDQSRFRIMQNVGMTKQDIRKTINAQVLTVFFLPLLTAGLHVCFAAPMIWRLLQMFQFTNLRLMIFVFLSAFLLFAVLYTLVYKLTANAYYKIVSGVKAN